jgi:hypothetical protein
MGLREEAMNGDSNHRGLMRITWREWNATQERIKELESELREVRLENYDLLESSPQAAENWVLRLSDEEYGALFGIQLTRRIA